MVHCNCVVTFSGNHDMRLGQKGESHECLCKMNVKSTCMSKECIKPFWSILIKGASSNLLFLWNGVARNIASLPG